MVDILDNYRIATYKHFTPEENEDKLLEEYIEFGEEIVKADLNDLVLHELGGNYKQEQADLYNKLRQKFLCDPEFQDMADKPMIRTIDRYNINAN